MLQIFRGEFRARRREDVDPAFVTRREGLEQMLVEAFGRVRQFGDLQSRFAVEVIAKMAGLEVKIDDADIALPGHLAGLEMNGRFQR